MNTKSVFVSGLRAVVMVGLLSLAASYTSVANAADGCGCGYHKSIYGGCILNYQGGGWLLPSAAYLGCWRTGTGQLRCHQPVSYYYY